MIGLGHAERDRRVLALDAVLVALLLAYVVARAWVGVSGSLGWPAVVAYLVGFHVALVVVGVRWKLTRADATP